jgi:hypothetical protein
MGMGWGGSGAMTGWPDWHAGKDRVAATAELVRYVDLSYTRGRVPADCLGPWASHESGRERAWRLYEALRASRIRYAHEPWNPVSVDPGGGPAPQRIRGPNETFQGPATCLDLALVFAGMAMAAGLRPLLAVGSGAQPHALVILDVARELSARAMAGTAPEGFAEVHGVPGVWTVTAGDGGGWLAGGTERDWHVVDVSRAAWSDADPDGTPYGEARLDIGQLLTDERDREARRWTLADVDRVRTEQVRSGLPQYTPPTGRSIPAIHGYLPALPAFTDFGSRATFQMRLRGTVSPSQPGAVLVLQGESGLGKSMLAHHLATGADSGCGWFLNATDAKVLTTSLAQAENEEKAQRGERPGTRGAPADPADDRALASAALDRLSEAERPWVVVLDNCESSPDASGLAGLVPQPHAPGQFVIITTTRASWVEYARRRGWRCEEMPGLTEEDLVKQLRLPGGLEDAIAGRPLVAGALASLRDYGCELPESAGEDGPALVWDLLRTSRCVPEGIRLAQSLAWCPPEPVDVSRLMAAAGLDPASAAYRALAALRFVTPVTGQVVQGKHEGRPAEAVQMHRLFASAVREWTWENEPGTAADLIASLLTSEAGRELFLDAADTSAFGRLERGPVTAGSVRDDHEPGDAARAAGVLTDRSRAGLLWHGLGRVRERRGPVSGSAPHFAEANRLLDAASYPFEVAEGLIGQVRVIYQDNAVTTEELIAARAEVPDARRLLEPRTDTDSRQLSEQGNALAWLITRKLAGGEKDPARREAALTEVLDNLWASYERRRRILRPDHHPAEKTAPEPDDELGSERAYFNLAGVYIQLAKVHADLTRPDQVAEDLAQAAQVYGAVRALRELRYGGRPHPHVAACVHGQALVSYYRAVLLGQVGQAAEALRFAAEAMEQRRKVAAGLAGPDSEAILSDTDMRKSTSFMVKASMIGMLGGETKPDRSLSRVQGAFDEALKEWAGRPARSRIGED